MPVMQPLYQALTWLCCRLRHNAVYQRIIRHLQNLKLQLPLSTAAAAANCCYCL
jgi:hypothetical protein